MMTRLLSALFPLLAFVVLLAPQRAHAQCQHAELIGADTAAGDQDGDAVDVDGDRVIVGASRDDDNGESNSGSAYVYLRQGATWVQEAKVTAGAFAGSHYHFGQAVAISADTAVVGGRETFLDYSGVSDQRSVDSRTRHGVHGWGFDLGATWQTRLPGRLSLTLGYAMGSGDVRSDSPKVDDQKSNDHSFRQTGLQDNNDRFRGVNSFKYYGELLRPELSNLRIATAALGFRFLKNSSVELIYHSYQQVEAAKFLRKATVRRQPAGRKRGIGHELDLVIGIEEWEHFEIELIAAGFRAGPAFGAHCDGELFLGFICEPVDVVSALDGEWSYLGLLKFKFNF